MQKNDSRFLFVRSFDNHDSPTRSIQLESFVEPWLKPMAYGLNLLREKGNLASYYW